LGLPFVLPPKQKENRKKILRSSVKAASTSSLMPSLHATKGKADREEEDTCNQSLLLGEEPNLSHHHTWTRLCLSRHCSSFCINIIALLEKLKPMINIKTLAHCCFITTLLKFCLFGFQFGAAWFFVKLPPAET
jgi:hypothetical protein